MKNRMIATVLAVLVSQSAFIPLANAQLLPEAQKLATQQQNSGQNMATACGDWSTVMSFEQATDEYMQLASLGSKDFGCLSRASWMATEDLFNEQNTASYITRLKSFDKKYKVLSQGNPDAEKALDQIKVVFQMRWLSDNYEGMKDFKSSAVVKGAAGATVAIGAMAGAALLLHNTALSNLGTAARPALIRMVRYLGAVIFVRTALSKAGSEGLTNKKFTTAIVGPPPLDLIAGKDQSFYTYNDLHLLRDIASATADALTVGATHTIVTLIAIRYFGATVASAGRFFSTSSLVGLGLGYVLGKGAGLLTDRLITEKYHKMHKEETARLAEILKSGKLTDWEQNITAAQLTNSAVAWVATQDLFMQTEVENKILEFSNWQICNRLHQRPVTLTIIEGQRRQNDAKQMAELKIKSDIGNDKLFINGEIKLRHDIYFEIEKKRDRYLEVRQGVLDRMLLLEKLNKPFLRNYIVEHRALIDRLDRHLNHDGLADDALKTMHAQAVSLSLYSEKWEDADYLKQVGIENDCHMN